MTVRLDYDLEILGISPQACTALRKCGISTVQDLLIAIDTSIMNKNEEQRIVPNVSMKEAILSVMQERANRLFDYKKVQEAILQKYGGAVSTNPNSIKTIMSRMAKKGRIHKISDVHFAYIEIQKNDQTINLHDAILSVLKESNGKPFTYKKVRDWLREKYNGKVSTATSSIKMKLKLLIEEGYLERTDTNDYVLPRDKIINSTQETLDSFLESHIGKEIEFRYKSKRAQSDKRWRREKVWAQDKKYMYVDQQYLSGHHIMYLKDRIVEFREVIE